MNWPGSRRKQKAGQEPSAQDGGDAGVPLPLPQIGPPSSALRWASLGVFSDIFLNSPKPTAPVFSSTFKQMLQTCLAVTMLCLGSCSIIPEVTHGQLLPLPPTGHHEMSKGAAWGLKSSPELCREENRAAVTLPLVPPVVSHLCRDGRRPPPCLLAPPSLPKSRPWMMQSRLMRDKTPLVSRFHRGAALAMPQ